MVIYKTAAGKQAVGAIYRRAVGRWPAPNDQRLVPTSQGDTFVVVSGPADAIPVVLLHGSGANSSVWLRHAAAWAGRFRLHAIDVITRSRWRTRRISRSRVSRVYLEDDGHLAPPPTDAIAGFVHANCSISASAA